VAPLESEVSEAAEALKWELNSFLPNVHIRDLLAEVDGWTRFSDKFTARLPPRTNRSQVAQESMVTRR
jgi:hypothetical protein